MELTMMKVRLLTSSATQAKDCTSVALVLLRHARAVAIPFTECLRRIAEL